MTMTIPAGILRPARRPALLDDLAAAWQVWQRRRALRADLRRAGRLGPRLLADMGIDTEAVEGWDALTVSLLLVPGRR